MSAVSLARFITDHRQRKQVVDAFPADIRPASELEAIKAALEQAGTLPPAWKLGGTNALTRDMFQVGRAYFGPLRADELVTGEIELAGMVAPKVEPEFCVVFDADLDPDRHGGEPAALRRVLGGVALGLEIPDTILRAPPQAGVFSLIADRCAAGRLVLGDWLPVDTLEELQALPVVMTGPDGTRSEGHGDWLIGGALAGVADMLESLRGLVDRVPAGTVIATGGLAPAMPLASGLTRFDAGPYSVMARAV